MAPEHDIRDIEAAFGSLSIISGTEYQADGSSSQEHDQDLIQKGHSKISPVSAVVHTTQCYFRVTDSSHEQLVDNGDIIARLFPAPPLDGVSLKEMQSHLRNHAKRYNLLPTPFISLTDDLLRAFTIVAQKIRQGQTEVTILVIDPSRLGPGSFIACKELWAKSHLTPDDLHLTEILVWEKIPREAIVIHWHLDPLCSSGFFRALPYLQFTNTDAYPRVNDLRNALYDHDFTKIRPGEVISILCRLGMPPSSMRTKHIFTVLMEEAIPYSCAVCKYPGSSETFDEIAYKIARRQHRDTSISGTDSRGFPSFSKWSNSRAETYGLEYWKHRMVNPKVHGLRKYAAELDAIPRPVITSRPRIRKKAAQVLVEMTPS